MNTPTVTESLPTYRSLYRSLDHWRGIAALMVIVYHATAHYRVVTGDHSLLASVAQAQWLGVQLFFVISGYCITAAVEGSFRRSDHPVSGYLVRRVRRVFPPYLCWLAILCVVIGIVESLAPQLLGRDSYRLSSLSMANWFGNISLTETWWPHLLGQNPQVITRVGWTLCYEIQFYVICMCLMFLPRKHFYHSVVIVSLIVLFVFLFERPMGLQWKLVGTFLDGRWLQFAMGIWVFHAMTKGTRRSRLVAGAGLAIVSVVSFACLDDYTFGEAIDLRMKRILELSVCGAFSVILLLVRSMDDWVGALSWLNPLQKVGIFSYSLYLVHWPICKVLAQLAWKFGLRSLPQTLLITTPVCMAISVLAGIVFFRFFEKPFIATGAIPNSASKLN